MLIGNAQLLLYIFNNEVFFVHKTKDRCIAVMLQTYGNILCISQLRSSL